MTKHDVLTDEEFKVFMPPTLAVAQLDKFMSLRGAKEKDIKVLDWGCGRGRFVLWLRERGFNAYGVDIDPEPIENGLILFREKGYQNNLLTLIDVSGRTQYPQGFFDYVLTGNVFEHVQDINNVISEISRITMSNGGGYHIFPAQRQFIEGHLFMPIVHWIPEGSLRKTMIGLFVKLGREPKWKEVESFSDKEKTEIYYKYSIEKTYYRPYSAIKKIFAENGFKVVFETINNPAVIKNKILGKLIKMNLIKPIINWALLTFKQVEIVVRKE